MSDDSETKQMAIKMWEKVLKKTHQKNTFCGGTESYEFFYTFILF